jgi:hypothetical protein
MVFATLAAWGVDEEPILEIDVFADAIDFTLAHAEISALHLQVFDVENQRIFTSGLREGPVFEWDLVTDLGELAAPGTYFFTLEAWDGAGEIMDRRSGKVAVRPDEMDPEELSVLAPGSDDYFLRLANFDDNGIFTVRDRIGVGTESPKRAIHIQGRNAVFQMDRDKDTAAFLLVRTALGNFNNIWGAWVLGANASGPGQGSFIINDLKSKTSGAGTRRVTINPQGLFGINTSAPEAALHVRGSAGRDLLVLKTSSGAAFKVQSDGDVFADGSYNCGLSSNCFNAGSGADVAERIDSLQDLEPGDVVEIDPDRPMSFRRTGEKLSRRVAGIISTAPAITLGNNFDADEDLWEDERPLLALAGRVPLKATAEPGAIGVGDLLVSSAVPGRAMRCATPSQCIGAVVGKALEPLAEGHGTIEVQVMLR